MRILLFPTRFYPAISGGDFFLQRMGELFQKQEIGNKNQKLSCFNHEVLVLTSDAIDFASIHGEGKFLLPNHKYFSKYHNLSLIRYPVERNLKQLNREKHNLEVLFEKHFHIKSENINNFIENGPIFTLLNNKLLENDLPKEIKNFKPDIIHCSYLPYNNLVYALLIGKILQIPVIVTPFLHNENIRYQNQNIFHILNLFDGIFACTFTEKKILIRQSIQPEKIYIVPMGIDFKKFRRKAKKREKRVQKIYQLSHPTILFCGYKNYEKGAITLLDSIPNIYQKYPQTNYVMIGPSTAAYNYKLQNVKALLPDVNIVNITPDNLTGVLDSKKIGIFQYADIFCMPSRSDAYGIVYLEAWATKTPVIGARNPQMQDVIEENKDGLLVKFDDKQDLSKKIIYLLDHPEKRQRMGLNGFNKIFPHQSWQNISQKINSLYCKIIESWEK